MSEFDFSDIEYRMSFQKHLFGQNSRKVKRSAEIKIKISQINAAAEITFAQISVAEAIFAQLSPAKIKIAELNRY
jgi:hypothetical protein